jgi:hypothetical protein
MTRFESKLIEHGIDKDFAKTFCRSLGCNHRQLADDFSIDPEYWIRTYIMPEIMHFVLLSSFPSDQSFKEYLAKQGFRIFLLNDDCLRVIYREDYSLLVELFRKQFLHRLLLSKNLRMQVIQYAPEWFEVSEVRSLLIETLKNAKTSERQRAAYPLGFDKKKYRQIILYPKMFHMKVKYKSREAAVDYAYLTELFGQNHDTINKEVVPDWTVKYSKTEYKYSDLELSKILNERWRIAVEPMVEAQIQKLESPKFNQIYKRVCRRRISRLLHP